MLQRHALNSLKFSSNDFQAGAPEEKTAAYDSYIGYCGRYEVNEQERSIVLHFALSTYPNWTGTSQNRFAEIVGNRLRISTPPIRSGGKEIVNAIVWERPKWSAPNVRSGVGADAVARGAAGGVGSLHNEDRR